MNQKKGPCIQPLGGGPQMKSKGVQEGVLGVEPDREAAGQRQQAPAVEHQGAQRDDQGVDAELGHQEAVDGADGETP